MSILSNASPLFKARSILLHFLLLPLPSYDDLCPETVFPLLFPKKEEKTFLTLLFFAAARWGRRNAKTGAAQIHREQKKMAQLFIF